MAQAEAAAVVRTSQLLAAWRERSDAALALALDEIAGTEPRLHAAMRHAVLLGGKRMRPLLVYASGHACGVAAGALDAPAVAVELIHAYSLVHDDLPAMDDDALRRGQPTVHVAFDEATAILAGDALQSLAFSVLADASHPPERIVPMLRELAAASGANGMCGGQAFDLAATGNRKWGQRQVSDEEAAPAGHSVTKTDPDPQVSPQIRQPIQPFEATLPSPPLWKREGGGDLPRARGSNSAEQIPLCPPFSKGESDLGERGETSDSDPIFSPIVSLERLHALKTGALLRASVRLGAIAAGAGVATRERLDVFADALGLAFQIRDDLLDIEGDSATLGKTAGKDALQDKATFPALIGADASRQRLAALAVRMQDALGGCDGDTAPLAALGRMAIERNA